MRKNIASLLLAATFGAWHTASHAQDQPTPADPYPLAAAGWGPEAGGGLWYSRWVEDWSAMRAAGSAPSLKALPLGGRASLTFSTETRLRYDAGQINLGDDYEQSLLRSVLGADLRLNRGLRLYAELGSGYAGGLREASTPHFENKESLQQLFVEARTTVRGSLVGAMIGRQEFTDGPRQLVSLSDGPNLHRTWNGARLYLHRERFRLGAFDLRATRLGRGGFDEDIDRFERLAGVNASLVVATDVDGHNTYLEPFWIHSRMPVRDAQTVAGADKRDTFGARLWGQRGNWKLDVTLARQTGRLLGRDVEAWGFFATQSLALSDAAWKPRLTTRIDVATGDRAGSATHERFNPLYPSSNYLGEGRLLGLGNLLLIAPGFSVSPAASTSVSVEYGFARRLVRQDAVYAGGMRAYAGTRIGSGHDIGGLARLTGSWTGSMAGNNKVTLAGGYEYLSAGKELHRARLASGSYGHLSVTFRY